MNSKFICLITIVLASFMLSCTKKITEDESSISKKISTNLQAANSDEAKDIEKIDVRNFYFPKRSIIYQLINPNEPNDIIDINVNINNDGKMIEIEKVYRKLGVKNLGIFEVGEDVITNTSFKVGGSETLSSPKIFKRFITLDDQFGPIEKDQRYSKNYLEKGYLVSEGEGESSIIVSIPNINVFSRQEPNSKEDYCEGIGLTHLKLDEKGYVLNANMLTNICSDDSKSYLNKDGKPDIPGKKYICKFD